MSAQNHDLSWLVHIVAVQLPHQNSKDYPSLHLHQVSLHLLNLDEVLNDVVASFDEVLQLVPVLLHD